MCPPVAAALAAAAAVVGAAGQIQAGKAQKRMAEHNAQVTENAAQYNASRQQDRARRLMAQGRVAVAKSGIDLSGSPLDVMVDSAMDAELDRQSILRMGASQAELDRMQGRAAMRSSYFGAATSLLSGASRAVGMMSGGPASMA